MLNQNSITNNSRMKKSKYLKKYYEDEDILIFQEKNTFLLNKRNEEYFLCKNNELLSEFNNRLKICKQYQTNYYFVWVLFFILLLSSIKIFELWNITDVINNHMNWLLFITSYIITIIVHEFGHVVTYKIFSRHKKIKFGFKFLFIFPAFYVDISKSYLLPNNIRKLINFSGIISNIIFSIIIQFFIINFSLDNSLLIVNRYFVVITFFNLIPLTGSDGYRAINLLFYEEDFLGFNENSIRYKVFYIISLVITVIVTLISIYLLFF